LNNDKQFVPHLTIAERIWKYKLHYLIVIPALILIIVFKLIPLVTAFAIPFMKYDFASGLFHSPWVGMANFYDLFSDPTFKSIISNTLIMKFSYMLVSGIVALLISLALSHIRSRRLGQVYTTIFLLPFFIPTVVLTYLVMLILSIDKSPFPIEMFILGQPQYFRPILVIVEVLHTCGIPILIALAAIAAKHRSLSLIEQDMTGISYIQTNMIPAIRAVGAFLLLQLSTILTVNFELVYSMVNINPLVMKVGETLDTYGFRIGFMYMDISLAGTIWFLQFIVQLVFTVLAYLLVRTFFVQDLFSRHEGTSTTITNHRGKSWIGVVVGAMNALVILFVLYLLFIYPYTLESESGIGVGDIMPAGRFILFLVLTLVAVIVHLLITLTLAYPLTVKDLPGVDGIRDFY
jgi:putative aldouronate transport system permease protein